MNTKQAREIAARKAAGHTGMVGVPSLRPGKPIAVVVRNSLQAKVTGGDHLSLRLQSSANHYSSTMKTTEPLAQMPIAFLTNPPSHLLKAAHTMPGGCKRSAFNTLALISALVGCGFLSSTASAQTTIFSENMGTPSGTTTIAANTFQNSGSLTYSGTADVRNSTVSSGYTGASGGGNVFFTTTAGVYFQIANINTLNYSSFGLTFGANKLTNASTLASDFPITFTTSGASGSITYPAQASGTGTTGYRLVTASSIPLVGSANLALRFTNTLSTASASIRLDDVKLTGTLRTAAATLVWNGAALNGNWYDGNWTGNNAPINGDALQFDGTAQTNTTNNVPNLLNVASITFNSGAGAFTNGGSSVAVTGGITNNSANLQTINHGISFGDGIHTIDTTGENIVIGGTISATGGVSVLGGKTLTLSVNNSYAGGTLVGNGKLKVSNSSGSATGTGDVTVNNGGTLMGGGKITGAVTVNGAIGNASDGVASNLTTGALTLSSTSTTALDILTQGSFDQITTTGTLAYGGALTLFVDAGFSGSGTFQIFKFSGSESGDFSSVTATGYSGQVSFDATSGIVTLQGAEVPEPTTVLGGLALISLIGIRERRRFSGLKKLGLSEV